MLTPKERHLRAQIGAYALHASHDPKETTAKARRAFMDRFLREVDPRGELNFEERKRRAEYAKKAYFAKLALRSAKTRRKVPRPMPGEKR